MSRPRHCPWENYKVRKESLTQHSQVVCLMEIPICCYYFAGVISLMGCSHLPYLKGRIPIWCELPVYAVTAVCFVYLVLISPVSQAAGASNLGAYFPCYHSYTQFGSAGEHRAVTCRH